VAYAIKHGCKWRKSESDRDTANPSTFFGITGINFPLHSAEKPLRKQEANMPDSEEFYGIAGKTGIVMSGIHDITIITLA